MKITRETWDRTHDDFKGGETDGERRLVILNRDTGATVSVPVEIVEEVMPGECAHPRVRIWRTDAGWAEDPTDRHTQRPKLARHTTLIAGCPNCGVAGRAARTSAGARALFYEDFPPATGDEAWVAGS